MNGGRHIVYLLVPFKKHANSAIAFPQTWCKSANCPLTCLLALPISIRAHNFWGVNKLGVDVEEGQIIVPVLARTLILTLDSSSFSSSSSSSFSSCSSFSFELCSSLELGGFSGANSSDFHSLSNAAYFANIVRALECELEAETRIIFRKLSL